MAELSVCFAELRIECERLVDGGARVRKSVARRNRAVDAEQGIRLGKTHVCAREHGIALDRGGEVFDRAAHPGFVAAQIEPAVGIQLIRFRIARLVQQLRANGAKLRHKCFLHTCCDCVLHGENIGECLVVGVRDELPAVLRIDQAHGDAQPISDSLEITLEHRHHAELPSGSQCILVLAGVAANRTQRAYLKVVADVETADQRLRHAELERFVAV